MQFFVQSISLVLFFSMKNSADVLFLLLFLFIISCMYAHGIN